MVKKNYDLSELKWKLSGWIPYLWQLKKTMEVGASPNADILPFEAKVPGSVQKNLLDQGVIPDWNIGLNYREGEWVENRHWFYETHIPAQWVEEGRIYRLHCDGLDYKGWIYINGKEVGRFEGSHIPHVFDITSHLKNEDNRLNIVFDTAPRWLGQFGYTSQMKDWKVRFNYTWDWVVRLLQTGIWDSVRLESVRTGEFSGVRGWTDVDLDSLRGSLKIVGQSTWFDGARVRAFLKNSEGHIIREQEMKADEFNENGFEWVGLEVDLWWPNLEGDQPLYALTLELLDSGGRMVDELVRTVGFKNVYWGQNLNAPQGADPWICHVNGKAIFLQGVNWVPPLPNFADVTEEHYEKLLTLYQDLGANILRVWGGAILEREMFYDICDKLGILVWQEFPLSSSGIDNTPPDDEKSVNDHEKIARSYIERRQHHVSLLMWCGGNELEIWEDAEKDRKHPSTLDHPLHARQNAVVQEMDPARRFVPTSPSGPRFCADASEYGKGLHWDIHGPWKAETLESWRQYWDADDSLMRSEAGQPGASSAEIIRQYAGNIDPQPGTAENPLWRRTSPWWVEWHVFVDEYGREPLTLDEYVIWSQNRQAEALSYAARSCRDRFPKCGGFIVWMGHDCFPCTANTAIIDFHCEPKPAAMALKDIWRDRR